jgi:hypothetical protein
VNNVAAYEISADRRKLVYRAALVAVADSLVVQAQAVERHRLRSCSSSMPIEHRHNPERDV